MDLEELHKKVESNSKNISHNRKKIDENSKKIKKNSYALEILKDYKTQNKRLFVILIVMLFIWVVTIVLFHM